MVSTGFCSMSSYRMRCTGILAFNQKSWKSFHTVISYSIKSFHARPKVRQSWSAIDKSCDPEHTMLNKLVIQSRGLLINNIARSEPNFVFPYLSGQCVLVIQTRLSTKPSPARPKSISAQFNFFVMSQSDPVTSPIIFSIQALRSVLPDLGQLVITTVSSSSVVSYPSKKCNSGS